MRRSQRGFSLMEVMVALGVLAFASSGALAGLIFASKQFKLGQNSSHGTVLAERLMQRVRLANKQKIINAATTWTGSRPQSTAASVAPWVTASGNTTVLGNLSDDGSADFSRGAFFTVDGMGVEQRKTIAGINTCADMLTTAAVPGGIFCREMAIVTTTTSCTPGPTCPTLGAALYTQGLQSGTAAAEVLVRVWRKGEPGTSNQSWTLSEVVVQ
jgi:prepilin-type N-terminal cleavage/methylation domain-containing protein